MLSSAQGISSVLFAVRRSPLRVIPSSLGSAKKQRTTMKPHDTRWRRRSALKRKCVAKRHFTTSPLLAFQSHCFQKSGMAFPLAAGVP